MKLSEWQLANEVVNTKERNCKAMLFDKLRRELTNAEIGSICADIKELVRKKNEPRPEVMYSDKEPFGDGARFSERAPITDWSKLAPSTYTFARYISDALNRNNISGLAFYKRAGIGRKIFWNIINDAHYNPSKETAAACALGLHLNVQEGRELLSKAGYSLSDTILFDIVIEYCLEHKIYNIMDVNEILESLGAEKLLRTE